MQSNFQNVLKNTHWFQNMSLSSKAGQTTTKVDIQQSYNHSEGAEQG